jgi:hypothetical protein
MPEAPLMPTINRLFDEEVEVCVMVLKESVTFKLRQV